MKVLLLSLCLGFALGLTADQSLRIQFAKFKVEHNKVYKTRSEDSYRFNIFAENVAKMNAHNKAGRTYTMGQ